LYIAMGFCEGGDLYHEYVPLYNVHLLGT